MTNVYLANTGAPTAYLDQDRAETNGLEHFEVDLDGKPMPSHLMYAVNEHGDCILTACSESLAEFCVDVGPVTISTVELTH